MQTLGRRGFSECTSRWATMLSTEAEISKMTECHSESTDECRYAFPSLADDLMSPERAEHDEEEPDQSKQEDGHVFVSPASEIKGNPAGWKNGKEQNSVKGFISKEVRYEDWIRNEHDWHERTMQGAEHGNGRSQDIT